MKRTAQISIWLGAVVCLWLAVRLTLLWLYRESNHSWLLPFWYWDGTAAYASFCIFVSALFWNLFWIKSLKQLPVVFLFAIVGSGTFLVLLLNTLATAASSATLLQSLEETLFGSNMFVLYTDDAALIIFGLVNPVAALLSAIFFTVTFRSLHPQSRLRGIPTFLKQKAFISINGHQSALSSSVKVASALRLPCSTRTICTSPRLTR